MAAGIAHGGWCPRGRLAEDGSIPARYQLEEMPSAEYAARTERNVVDSDATLILTRGPLSGGTELTLRLAKRHGRPHMAADLDEEPEVERVHDWLRTHRIEVLNIAGPRESTCPGIADQAEAFVRRLLAPW